MSGFHHRENENSKEKEGYNIIFHHLSSPSCLRSSSPVSACLASIWDTACILPEQEYKIRTWALLSVASTLASMWFVLVLELEFRIRVVLSWVKKRHGYCNIVKWVGASLMGEMLVERIAWSPTLLHFKCHSEEFGLYSVSNREAWKVF